MATPARSLVLAVGILLTTLGVCALIGWMGLLRSQGEFGLPKAVKVTQGQVEALRWATRDLGEVRSKFDEVEFG
ncbi:hypothetical protein H6S82_26685 [Planktothrix sp. FACHB-1355]|uniref:Uncharacterized protein n=1 Tax=Aerosakkonema funiforme FACHB-1375 TaxID=2949571 RepID=A0A926ZJ28_9CYAN|nr:MULTISPECIES: hypothetical protein [Oscillatoriales]MBD2183907.1 hypothetical protein [Aerosakkonema funiforme FACHB-1375]MBD3562399.1 hypothetical protein [Planktothrix sp. FACHB-1355]